MKFLILSYFHSMIGPKILFQAPESSQNDSFDEILSLMDLRDEGFFVHISGGFKSANNLFEIPSSYARGSRDILLISFLISENEGDINIDITREFLERFEREIKKIKDAYKAFYLDSSTFVGDQNKLNEIRTMFYTFYESFIPAIEAVRIAELRFQALFKAARDAIIIIDYNSGIVIDANKQAENLFLLPAEEIIGLHYIQSLVLEENESFMEKILKQIQLENSSPILIRIKNAAGKSVPVEINANEIQMGGINLIQCIIRDVTERERAEEALRNAYERANFYKDLFTHDFNNIISNILSSLQLYSIYQNDLNRWSKTIEIIEIIQEQSIRGSNLISNIRKLSEIEDTKLSLKKIEVFEILDQVQEYIPRAFKGKHINIEIKSSTKKEHVIANNWLEDVFKNILTNAINHNKSIDIEIIIRFSDVQKEEKTYLKIEFLDNGMGIEDERKNAIFQKGQSKNVRGIGLGLYLVRRIIDSYNGQLWVEDRVKEDHTKGANFVLLIPKE